MLPWIRPTRPGSPPRKTDAKDEVVDIRAEDSSERSQVVDRGLAFAALPAHDQGVVTVDAHGHAAQRKPLRPTHLA